MPAPDRKKPKQGAARPTGKKAVVTRPAAKKAAPKKAAPKKAAPKKAPTRATSKPTLKKAAARPAQKKAPPKKAAPPGAGGSTAPKGKRTPDRKAPPRRSAAAPAQASRHDGPDPEGFFVARVRGEDAVRDAPHQMLEPGGWEEDPVPLPLDAEGLGELPWTYGDDLLVALPRDPRTLFVYWDHARRTLEDAFANLPGARVELWVFARGAGWERVRVVDVALEARGWYVHDLEPGRPYRAELHLIGSDGQDRLMPGPSVASALPPQGPSPAVDDRFASLPWDVPLPKLMGPGVPGGPFSEEARALLARLSGWSRFGHSRADGSVDSSADGGEGLGAPVGGPSSPTRPTSPGRKGT